MFENLNRGVLEELLHIGFGRDMQAIIEPIELVES